MLQEAGFDLQVFRGRVAAREGAGGVVRPRLDVDVEGEHSGSMRPGAPLAEAGAAAGRAAGSERPRAGAEARHSRPRAVWLDNPLHSAFWVKAIYVQTVILPRPMVHLGGHLVADVLWRSLPKVRREVVRNLARVRPWLNPARLERLTYLMFQCFARCLLDGFRASRMPTDRVLAELVRQFCGFQYIDEAYRSGRGAVLLTAHVGHWELGGMLLGRLGYPVHMVTHEERNAAIGAFRTGVRTRGGQVRQVLTGTSPLAGVAALSVLRRGGVVAMSGDRAVGQHAVRIPFFGRPSPFPTGPALLAAVAGAPIIPCFVLLEGRRYRFVAARPIDVGSLPPPGAPRRRLVEQATARVVEVIEEVVADHPEQWFNFYPVWPEGEAAGV